MRRAAVSIGVSILLMVATEAWAECAWVMWDAEFLKHRQGWHPTRTFASRNDCVRELERIASNWKQAGLNLIAEYDDDITASDSKTGGVIQRRCLPESIDPRGAWARLMGWLTGW